MIGYSSEKGLFEKGISIINYSETEVGNEYLIKDNGVYFKLLYKDMQLVAKCKATREEVSYYLSKDLKFFRLLCSFVKIEILLTVICIILFKVGFSISCL